MHQQTNLPQVILLLKACSITKHDGLSKLITLLSSNGAKPYESCYIAQFYKGFGLSMKLDMLVKFISEMHSNDQSMNTLSLFFD